MKPEDAFAGKTIVGLYFSAHWCPPCRRFTPKLVEAYDAVIAEGKPFEILFISDDRDENSYNEYYAQMPWLAFPFHVYTQEHIKKEFEVDRIPLLLIVDVEKNVMYESCSGPDQIAAELMGYFR